MSETIIYPKSIHKWTFIILHGMYSSANDIHNNFSNISNFFPNMKFILIESPIRNIDWPDGVEYNVKSWYNYYSRNDNKNFHDIIDVKQFNDQILRIETYIKNELDILKNNNVILSGYSQGGTLIFDLVLNSKYKVKSGIILHSVFMDNVIDINNIKNKKIPLHIISGEKDKIYNLRLQRSMINKLRLKNIYIDWKILNNISHCEFSYLENDILINIIKNIIKL